MAIKPRLTKFKYWRLSILYIYIHWFWSFIIARKPNVALSHLGHHQPKGCMGRKKMKNWISIVLQFSGFNQPKHSSQGSLGFRSTLSLWVIPVRLEASGGSIWLGPGFWKSEHPSIFDEDADLSFICMLSPVPTLERVLRSPEAQCPYKLFGFSPSNIIPCILCWWV